MFPTAPSPFVVSHARNLVLITQQPEAEAGFNTAITPTATWTAAVPIALAAALRLPEITSAVCSRIWEGEICGRMCRRSQEQEVTSGEANEHRHLFARCIQLAEETKQAAGLLHILLDTPEDFETGQSSLFTDKHQRVQHSSPNICYQTQVLIPQQQ